MTVQTQPAMGPLPTAPGDDIDREEIRVQVANQWQLMWWRFRKHQVAMAATVVTLLIYLVVIFAEFLAPVPSNYYAADYTFAPPQRPVSYTHLTLPTKA